MEEIEIGCIAHTNIQGGNEQLNPQILLTMVIVISGSFLKIYENDTKMKKKRRRRNVK